MNSPRTTTAIAPAVIPEKPAAPGSFWESPTIDDLAARQGVKPVESLDAIMGGWPEEEREDGFEQAVEEWRRTELERH